MGHSASEIDPCGHYPVAGTSQIAHYKIKAPSGYWRREFATRADARQVRDAVGDVETHEIIAFNLFGKVVWTEKLGYAHG